MIKREMMDTNTAPLDFNGILDCYVLHHNLRSATVDTYRKILRQFLQFAGENISPAELRPETVLKWQALILCTRRRTPQTWNTYLRHMSSIFSFAMSEGLVSHKRSPFAGRQVREGKKPRKTLTDQQLLRIIDELNALRTMEEQGGQLTIRRGRRSALQPVWFWKVLVDLLMMTGIRRNQLLHIRLMDVEIPEPGAPGLTRVFLQGEGSKNHDERWLPLPSELTDGLQLLFKRAQEKGMQNGDQLFNVAWFVEGMDEVKVNGMTERQTDSFFNQLSERCGFRISTHRFRHTLATALMKDPDRNISKVKALLGHRALSSTLVYIEEDPGEISNMLSRRVSSIRNLPGARKFLRD